MQTKFKNGKIKILKGTTKLKLLQKNTPKILTTYYLF